MAWKVLITKKCESDYVSFNVREHEEHDLVRDKKWLKHKSCSFSKSGRLIYRYNEGKIEIAIVRITPDHDYS